MTVRPAWSHILAAQAVLAALLCVELLGLGVSNPELLARRTAGDLHVSAPRLHFLAGKSLERLKDGAAVPFDFQLTIAAGSKTNVVARALERFTVSYDVWQEKFSVVRVRDFRKSNSNLSLSAAEAWCLDNTFVPLAGLPADRELWARLEIRGGGERAPATVHDSNISIATLIAIFSRTPGPQQDRWWLESGAFHLADLKP